MQHISLLVLFVLLYGFISALPVSAKIYINEFYSAESDDWIEIYNDSDEEISLSGYQLRDSTESHKKDLDGVVGGLGFTVIEWNWLNLGDDTIRLFYENNLVDEISYGTSSLQSPAKEQSAGRSEDGKEGWSIFSSHSKGSTNSESQIYTAPEPTPTLTPTSTKTPTPSRTPTPIRTPTQIKPPPPINVSVTTDKHIEYEASIQPTIKDMSSTESAVLGRDVSRIVSTPSQTQSSAPTERQVQTLGSEHTKSGGLAVITAGVLLLSSCGILLFRRYRHLFYR